MRLRALAFVLLSAGCAAKAAPPPSFSAEAAKADALRSEGCYSCLKEALSIYERQLTLKAPPSDAPAKAFDTALLIAIREKDLGIPAEESLTRARRLVIPSRSVLLDAAELIIGETSGFDPEQRALVTGRNHPALEIGNPRRRALDALPPEDVTAKYVALTIDCEQQKLIESVDLKALTTAYAGVSLMQFRLATCGRPAGPTSASCGLRMRAGRTRSIGKAAANSWRRWARPSTSPRRSASSGRAVRHSRHP